MLVVISLVAITASGCSAASPPIHGRQRFHGHERSAAGAAVAAKPSAASAETAPTWSWYSVASKSLNKGEAATVSGSRYKIQFVRGSLGQAATITIMARPSITDVMVGPNRMSLSKTAT
jgi:hypothetical protein